MAFNNHAVHSLYRIMVTVTSVVGMMKMGNIVPRVGMDLTSLAFQASVLPFHHVGSLMSPLYPHPPLYVAPCLRGHWRLLLSHCLDSTWWEVCALPIQLLRLVLKA